MPEAGTVVFKDVSGDCQRGNGEQAERHQRRDEKTQVFCGGFLHKGVSL